MLGHYTNIIKFNSCSRRVGASSNVSGNQIFNIKLDKEPDSLAPSGPQKNRTLVFELQQNPIFVDHHVSSIFLICIPLVHYGPTLANIYLHAA